MTTFIALFRGINVGGRNRLPMRELAKVLEGLGLQSIRTYIQSGNVVFRSEETGTLALAETIRSAIGDSHGFAPHVLLLDLVELEDAIAANPFPATEAQPKSLHLFFMDSIPPNPDVERLEGIRRDSERFCLRGRVFYLHTPDGVGRSKLSAQAEKALGVSATARNWRTVCKIREMASAPGSELPC